MFYEIFSINCFEIKNFFKFRINNNSFYNPFPKGTIIIFKGFLILFIYNNYKIKSYLTNINMSYVYKITK